MSVYSVLDEMGQELAAVTIIPEDMKVVLIEDAIAMLFQDETATMCFQFLQLDQCLFTFNTYRLTKPGQYRFVHDQPVLDLHISLNKHFKMTHKQQTEIQVPPESFNIRFWPEVDMTLELQAGDTNVFAICYNPEYLQKYVKFFSPVEHFLGQVNKGIHTHLAPNYKDLSPEMEHVINGMLYNNYQGQLKEFFLDAKALELLNLAIRETGLNDETRVMTPVDIERILHVKNIIEQRMDDPPTMAELSRMVGSNDYLLKRHFKHYFRTTIFDHLLKYRMEKAIQYLRENKLSLNDIALTTGYSSLAGFSKAFKKFFGYPPSKIREE